MFTEKSIARKGVQHKQLNPCQKAVRVQLGLGPEDKIRWNVEGGFARVSKAGPEDTESTYRLYKQTRGNSLYTALPAAVAEQLRMNDRSRVEWELQGGAAHVRKA